MPVLALLTSLASITPAVEKVAEKLPPDKRRELLWLIFFVTAAGLTLIIIVMLLLRVWRRSVARLQNERKKQLAAIPDIWKEGGNRLIAKMSPFPKADPSDAAVDDPDETPGAVAHDWDDSDDEDPLDDDEDNEEEDDDDDETDFNPRR